MKAGRSNDLEETVAELDPVLRFHHSQPRPSPNPLLRPGAYDVGIRGPNIEPQTLPIELRAQESRTVQVELR